MQRLLPVVDNAEGRRVDVVIEFAVELPELTDDDMTSLVTPLARVPEAAAASARLVFTGTAEESSVNIACDVTSAAFVLSNQLRAGADDQVEIVTAEDTGWCLIRHRLRAGVAANAFGG